MLPRLKAFALHLLLSACVAGLVFACIYWIWYPPPYFDLAKGRDLLLLVIGCDLVLGPLLTLAVFNLKKPRHELRRDLAIIGLLQLVGLAYGAHTMYIARPVYVVYNAGQFNVVQAASIESSAYAQAPASIPIDPKTGPVVVGAVLPEDRQTRDKIMFDAIDGGADVYQLPKYYVPYEQVKPAVAEHALEPAAYKARHDGDQAFLQSLVDEYAGQGKAVRLLPVVTLGRLGVAVISMPGGALLSVRLDPYIPGKP